MRSHHQGKHAKDNSTLGRSDECSIPRLQTPASSSERSTLSSVLSFFRQNSLVRPPHSIPERHSKAFASSIGHRSTRSRHSQDGFEWMASSTHQQTRASRATFSRTDSISNDLDARLFPMQKQSSFMGRSLLSSQSTQHWGCFAQLSNLQARSLHNSEIDSDTSSSAHSSRQQFPTSQLDESPCTVDVDTYENEHEAHISIEGAETCERGSSCGQYSDGEGEVESKRKEWASTESSSRETVRVLREEIQHQWTTFSVDSSRTSDSTGNTYCRRNTSKSSCNSARSDQQTNHSETGPSCSHQLCFIPVEYDAGCVDQHVGVQDNEHPLHPPQAEDTQQWWIVSKLMDAVYSWSP